MTLPDNWRAAWETEDNYWHENFTSRPYALGPDYYDRFRPAYRYGTWARTAYRDRDWDDRLETDLEQGWNTAKGGSRMAWNDAKSTVRESWDNFERALPGDFDRDGR